MKLPLQITFHHVQPSPAVATRIRAAVLRLDRYHPCIMSCRVVIEAVQRHQRRGQPYQVHIELGLPGRNIVVRQPPGRRPDLGDGSNSRTTKRLEPSGRHKDLYVTLHDAFDVLRRQLEDDARKHRGGVKSIARRTAA